MFCSVLRVDVYTDADADVSWFLGLRLRSLSFNSPERKGFFSKWRIVVLDPLAFEADETMVALEDVSSQARLNFVTFLMNLQNRFVVVHGSVFNNYWYRTTATEPQLTILTIAVHTRRRVCSYFYWTNTYLTRSGLYRPIQPWNFYTNTIL